VSLLRGGVVAARSKRHKRPPPPSGNHHQPPPGRSAIGRGESGFVKIARTATLLDDADDDADADAGVLGIEGECTYAKPSEWGYLRSKGPFGIPTYPESAVDTFWRELRNEESDDDGDDGDDDDEASAAAAATTTRDAMSLASRDATAAEAVAAWPAGHGEQHLTVLASGAGALALAALAVVVRARRRATTAYSTIDDV